jgi:hypothetical protein
MVDLGDLSLVVLAAGGLVGAEAAWMSRDARVVILTTLRFVNNC